MNSKRSAFTCLLQVEKDPGGAPGQLAVAGNSSGHCESALRHRRGRRQRGGNRLGGRYTSMDAICSTDGQVQGVLMAFRDASEARAASREMSRMAQLPLIGSSGDQCRWKSTSMTICTDTACPWNMAGLNLYCLTAAIAFSSNPIPRWLASRTSCGFPCESTMSLIETLP